MSEGKKKRKGFRQRSPPILKYLQGILRKYPDGGQILKELIQNADDAGAEEVILLYDERNFGTQTLFSEGLANAQGPALFAYNNALFSEEDWEGIQSPGVSHKADDPTTVGRFGLGFNSVYHVTDFPSVLSGEFLGVLDPQQTALVEGGQLWSVNEWEEAADQFQPFWAVLKSLGQSSPTTDGQFPGTLFRFPLRQSPSKISENLYSSERVQKLLLAFLNDAPISLMFLRNIRKLTLAIVGSSGDLVELLKAETTTHPVHWPEATDTKLGTAAQVKMLAVCGQLNSSADRSQWLVLSAEAVSDAFPQLWDLAVKVSSKPVLSLAYPLEGKSAGRLSCVLPLPATEENTTGLPVHISAPFQLTDDRRHVQWSEEGSQAQGADSRWNHVLMEQMLPAAYCQLVLLASRYPGDPYGAWPDPDKSQQLRYKPLVAEICQGLIDLKVLLQVGDGEPRRLLPREAVILPEKIVDTPIGRAVEKALILAESPLAEAPPHVRRALALGAKNGGVVKEATATFVRETLQPTAKAWSKMTALEKRLLLEFVMEDGCYQALKDLPLLPTMNGHFTCFGKSGETVYVECRNFPRILLPGLAHQFLPKDLNAELLKHLEVIAEKRLFRNLISLNQTVIEQKLQESLPEDWISNSMGPVVWYPGEYPKQPPLEWLAAFWSFLTCHASSLVPFNGCPLIALTPLCRSPGGIQLARLLPRPALVFQSHGGHSLSENVAGVLEKLGCTVIQNWPPECGHRQLKEYILEPTPSGVLQAFANLGVASVAGRFASLSPQQVESLSAFLSTVGSLSPKEAEIVSELPLFCKMPSILPPAKAGLVPAHHHLALEKNLFPAVPTDLLTPEPILLCRTEEERRLLVQIRGSLLGAPELCFLCAKAVKTGAYANHAKDAERLMLWILHNGDVLFNQSRELQFFCQDLPFLDNRSGRLGRPADFYDPENQTLRDLLRPCCFPIGPFQTPAALRTLRTLGLKSDLSAVCPADALRAAEEVNQLQQTVVANARSRALIQICNQTPLLSRFSSQELKLLRSLRWVPATNSSVLGPFGHFLAPEVLRSKMYADLVGLVMGVTDAFNPQAEEKLGLASSPPSEKVRENLVHLAQNYHPEETSVLTAKLHSIYEHMQQYLYDFQKPPTGLVVWNGTGFSLPADVVLTYPEGLDLAGLMYQVPPGFQQYSELFVAWGVRKSPKAEEVCQALHRLAEQINAQPQGGTQAQLLLVTAVLDWLCAQNHQGEEEIPVPARLPGLAGFALRPASSVMYCDMDRGQLAKLDGESPILVHEMLSSATAVFFGVTMLSTKLSGLEVFEAWGPSEPITLRIRNILREYNQDADVFQELLQNAEDAGAKSCRFLIDLRHSNGSVDGLLDPGMAACQGPALWAQNDALFSEADFTNIIRLGAATKERQDDKIGRFGLGFCTVYHLTDVPSLLSGSTMLIFDPNLNHLQKHIRDLARPGIRLNLNKQLAATFPEQFQPFRGIFGWKPVEYYKGTLLRLPFRTEREAEQSQICSVSFGPKQIASLQVGFQEMYQCLLIFLHNVQEVSLTQLSDGSCSPEAVQPLATVSRQVLDELGTSSIVRLTATWASSVFTSHYLLHSCSAQGEVLKLFRQGAEHDVHFSPPVAGVALPIRPAAIAGRWVPDLEDFRARVFCFLPLPIESGLPLHLTAAFAVQSNRKGLWDTAEKGEWNKALLRDAVLRAWLGALFKLQDMYKQGMLEDYKYYTFWPDVLNAKYPFSETVKAFYQALVEGIGGEQPALFSDGQQWFPARHACILEVDMKCEEHLKSLASKIFSLLLPKPHIAVSVPEWVKMNFKTCAGEGVLLANTYHWVRFLRELVLPNLSQLEELNRDPLILCALDLDDASVDMILAALRCIPTTPNKELKKIKELVHPSGRAAPLYAPEDGCFPMGREFLKPERLLRLQALGMAKDWVAMDELIDRAKTVATLWQHDRDKACQRASCILDLLDDHLQKSSSNAAQAILRDIPFLPAVLPANQCKLCCPSEMYYSKLHPLVGLIEPILDKTALGKGSKISKEVKEFLGLSRQPPVTIVLRQLEEASLNSNALPRRELADIVRNCYSFLNDVVQNNPACKVEVSQKAQTFPFVLVGSGFVSVQRVACSLAFDATPYLYQLPEEYRQQRELWKTVGLPDAFALEDYTSVLQTLAENTAGKCLSEAQLNLVILLITGGLAGSLPENEQLDSYKAQSVFFPDQDKILRPLPKLLFDDTPWMPREPGSLLCHAMIPRETARRCGIPTTKSRVLSRRRIKHLSPWATDFGAKEDLCTRLANILNDYPCSQDVLKELLQNADDAGATMVHFLWDQRSHPSKRVFSEAWEVLQGPALCVYNDRPFQQQDIEGIQRLGSGGKGQRREATGKYGLGFNTVYHLTDCPAFVTRNTALCVFDPTLLYLPESDEISPGAMYNLTKDFKDTFKDVYDAFLPDMLNLDEGTLFRLPLRTPAGAASSRISQSVASKQVMEDMMTALKEEADCLLLFLNHIRCVVFSVISDRGGPVKEVIRVTTEGGDTERLEYQQHLQQAAAAGGKDEGQPIKIFYKMKVNTSISEVRSEWLVGRQVGMVNTDGVESTTLPHGSIAARLYPPPPLLGRAFCTLPLPVKTGLPIHVNGNFSVDSARRDLRKDSEKSDVNMSWNSLLLRYLLAPLYCHLLNKLRQALESVPLQFCTLTSCQEVLDSKYLCYFPFVTESVPPVWQQLVAYVYELVQEEQFPLVPVYQKQSVHKTELVNISWSVPKVGNPIRDPYFLQSEIKDDLEFALQNLGMPLVPAFQRLQAVHEQFIKAGVDVLALDSFSLCCFLKNLPALCFPCPLKQTPIKNSRNYSALLKFCLDGLRPEADTNCLEDLPLLVTQDNMLRCFSQQDPVYFSSASHLFQRHQDRFSAHISAEASTLLIKTGHLKKFTLPESVDYIRELLARDNWISSDKGQKWLCELWKFFEKQICKSDNRETMDKMFAELVLLFKECAILPVCGCSKFLVPLESLDTVIPDNSSEASNILWKLGFAKLESQLLPAKLFVYLIQPRLLQVENPIAVLEKLAAHHSLRWDQLKLQEFGTLLWFLSRDLSKLKNDHKSLSRLKALPLFETHQGKHVSLVSYQKVYRLQSKISPELVKFKELYEVDERTVLLKDSGVNQHLSKCLNIGELNDLQQFVQQLLPRLPDLPEAHVLEAVKLLLLIQTPYYEEYEAVKKTVVSQFQSFHFIRDKQKVLRPVSYFYDESISLFQELGFCSQFVPDTFYKSVWPGRKWEVKQFLIEVGLKQVISEDDFLKCAEQVERDALSHTANSDDLSRRRKALLQHLLSMDKESLSDAFLGKISKLRFLVPRKIPNRLCNLHSPYVSCDTPVASQGSLFIWGKVELCWTSTIILDFSYLSIFSSLIFSEENTQDILTRLGVVCTLPAHVVLKNLSNVCQAPCNTQEVRKTRGEVLQSMYEYLLREKNLGTDCLKGVPVVLVDGDEITEAQNVVVTLKCPTEFRPYLYKLPSKLGRYMDVLEKFGVGDEPNIHHYARVLARIYEETSGKVTLQPNLIRTVNRATQFLFQLLEDEDQPVELKELHLPCIDGKLYPSSNLVFSLHGLGQELEALQTKFHFLVDLSVCSLAHDKYQQWKLLCRLPEVLRPKNLRDIVGEQLDESSLTLCAYRHHCEPQKCLKELLVSFEFQYAVLALLKWQNGMKAAELVKLEDGLFSPEQLEVVCCEKLTTIMVHDSQLLTGTQCDKTVHIKAMPDGKQRLYVTHYESLTSRQSVQRYGILAKELNKLLGEKINQDGIMVLMVILTCQNPGEIAKVLKEHKVPLQQPPNVNSYNLPPAGEEIPEEWYDSLDMDIFHTFAPGDYVGYLDSSQQGEHYFYAIVLQVLGLRQSGTGEVVFYLVDLGKGEKAEVSAYDLYHFQRSSPVSDLSKAVVPAEGATSDANFTERAASGCWHHRPLKEVKKEVDAYLVEIWCLSEDEKRKALRRLYLCYHPDKNVGQEDAANEIFKYLKQKIQEMEEKRKPGSSSGGPRNGASRERNFSYCWAEWDQQAHWHQQKRQEFTRQRSGRRGGGGYGGHFHYNFWSFHRQNQSKPFELQEAMRWLRQAERDLQAAAGNAGRGSTEWLLYMIYRALQKALTAIEYYEGKQFDKTLSLAMLAGKVASYGAELKNLPDQIDKLRQHGVDDKTTQYPSYHDVPTIPNEAFPACKEQVVLLLAREIVNIAKKWIGQK